MTTGNNVFLTHRTCRGSCGRTLPREAFRKKGKRGDVRYTYCEDCWPEYVEHRRETSAGSSSKYRELRRSGDPVDREAKVWLDAHRIYEWVRTLPGSEDEIAARLGTTPRQVLRWRTGEAERTALDSFDRMLCHAGMPWVLKELFPELWEFEEDAPEPVVVFLPSRNVWVQVAA